MTKDASHRKYELDWLRVLAILSVFLYHSTRFFNLGDWHVKNVNTYVWVEIWNIFTTRWMMPLFFIISGASLFYAMRKSGGWRKFYVDKFLRLMIPVLVASVTHSALQVYLERLNHGQFSGSFISFLSEYFNGVYLGIGMTGNFAYHGMHLWYLLFLFIYSMICYRLFVWLRGTGRDILNRIMTIFAIPGLMYIWFSIPLLIMKAIIPEAVLRVGSGGWGFLYYIWFLISGFMIISSERVQQQIKNQRWISLLSGMVLSIVYLYQLFSPSRVILPAGITDWIYALLSFLSAWSWLFAILGFGMRFLSFDRPFLRYANEGVLPFFILHQTVLLGIGYFIMAWKIPDVLKWAIVFTSSFIVIISIYTFLIRKLDLFRFLFGMKTTHSFFKVFRKKSVLIAVHVLYMGLIVFAVVNQITGAGRDLSPMPLMYDPGQDILLNAESITSRSSTGVRVVKDKEASIGQAIEFYSGANQRAESQPTVYVDMAFSAPAGRYVVWLRGKSDINSGYTDSVWLQVDDQIGAQGRSVRLGNWLDVHPPGVYGWASDTDDPMTIELKHSGDHTIRIQPRQTPHRIDQIWLSRAQPRIPNTLRPIK
ncbi:MAG: acyltransferase family protein [Deltaproteobacteria bacterium]|nr:acyltransferase family protein [Deltaproteobacteria bacterium]